MIGEALSIVGLGFDYISGIKSGKQIERLIEEVRKMNQTVQKLSDNVYYSPDIIEINHAGHKSFNNIKQINHELSQFQKAVGGDILSSAMVTTSSKIKAAFKKDPFEVLDFVRPINRSKNHPNPEMVPLVFEEGQTKYVGWIMKGLLPVVFDIEYQPSNNLYLPGENIISSISTQETPQELSDQKEKYFIDARDGQKYTYKKFGETTWMTRNLNYDIGKGAWYYDNNKANGNTYGMLYTWRSAIQACPSGWRLPTEKEVIELVKLHMEKKDKWWTDIRYNKKAYNKLIEGGESGFEAKKGGYIGKNGILSFSRDLVFRFIGVYGHYWFHLPENKSYPYLGFQFFNNTVGIHGLSHPNDAYSVRCVKID